MKKYIIKMRANELMEAAIGQEIITTFEFSAVSENAARFRAQKMMSFIMDGYIEEKRLNPTLGDDGANVIEIKEA